MKEIEDKKKIIVAVDGYSSSGKSTMARELARRVGYIYIDSGAMYRAVTLYALRKNYFDSEGNLNEKALIDSLDDIRISFNPSKSDDGVQHTILNGEDVEKEIRDMTVSKSVSPVARIPEVRERMVRLQQDFGLNKGVVMDGRDIGTVVFPDAELKIFVYADVHERARRRWAELTNKGEEIFFEDVLTNLKERDRIDTTRSTSPLRKADDAIELDNGAITHEEQIEWLMQRFLEATEDES